MRFLTKAKPVKIRITSGGEEHFSLESLKNNFCVEDVVSILDERLVRWLKQLNENKLADDIECLINEHVSNSESLTLKTYQVFFKDYEFNNLFELVRYWKEQQSQSQNYQYLVKSILYTSKVISTQYQEFIIDIFENNFPFKKDEINFSEIYKNKFVGKSHSEKIDIFAAICQYEGVCGFEANKEEGLKLIRKFKDQICYKFQNEEINKILENSKKRQTPLTRYELFKSFEIKKRRKWKYSYWGDYEYKEEYKNKIPTSIEDLTESENIIFTFIRSCVEMIHNKNINGYNYATNTFKINPVDILAFEKQTVNLLIGRSSNREVVEYLKMYNKYNIAKSLLKSYQIGEDLNRLVKILLDNFIEEGINDDINITFTPYNQVAENNNNVSNNKPVFNQPSTRKDAFLSFPLIKLTHWKSLYWKNYQYSEGYKFSPDSLDLTNFEKEIFSFIQRCVYLLDRLERKCIIKENNYETKYVKRDFLEFEIQTFFKILNCSEYECKEFLKRNMNKHLLAKDMLTYFSRNWDKKFAIIYFLGNFVSKAQQE